MGESVKMTLWLRHEAGHKEPFTWTIRLGSDAPGTPQGAKAPVIDEQAATRAKRRLLMDALNIVVDAVSSAEDAGDGTLASPEETEDLFKRLVTIGGDQKRFLAVAGVESWDKISKVALPILQRLLAERERAAAARKGAA